MKHMYTKDCGGNSGARVKFRGLEGRGLAEDEDRGLGIPGPEEVAPAEIRQAFDKGEVGFV